MEGTAASGGHFKRGLRRAAPWAFDAACLAIQAAGAFYVVFSLAMMALFRPVPDWLPHVLILNGSSTFHGWLRASLPANVTPLFVAFELLSLFALYVASYVWLFSKVSSGTLGQQLFVRVSRDTPRHRALRNVLATLAHNFFAQALAWIALGLSN